jgi:hypothetical protein
MQQENYSENIYRCIFKIIPKHSSVKKIRLLPMDVSKEGVRRSLQVEYCHRGIDYRAEIKISKKIYCELVGSV